MGLDIRLPIGGMFIFIGGMLTVYGLLGPQQIYQRSLGLNVNFWWGLVLFVFGHLMVIPAWRRRR